jgi:assimilatory nitrate reductase catalytic subunit
MTKTIKTTCPYCGVGCGIRAEVDEQQHDVSIHGDINHPANFGRLCSKGSALGETIGLSGRLLQPSIHGEQVNWDQALNQIADTFSRTIAQYGRDSVAIYGSGQLLTEDYYVANKLMKGFIGSGNMDTNSRLCMSSSVAGHKRAFGSDTVPNCYADIELAQMIVLIGSNAAWCHPVSFQRIRAAKEANPDLKIVVIDPRKTASCDSADLHLAVASGSDAWLFNGLLAWLIASNAVDRSFIENHTVGFSACSDALKTLSIQQVAENCALSPDDIECFYNWFTGYDKVLSLYSQGINQSSSGTDKVNAIINCHLATGRIGKPGSGSFSLTGQPNAMGGREVGGLSHQLAAHMDFGNSQDIDKVARFWQTDHIATQPGLPAVALFDAIYEGTIKAVWIMGTNPVVSLPDANKVKKALQGCEFVVVSDCIAQTDTTAFAHVLLPATGWSEKDGTVTNSERCISRQRALFKPAGSARADWWIITEVARRMGFAHAFPYQSAADIFREHARLSGFENNGTRDFDISAFADISDADYAAFVPVQWPVNHSHPQGTERLFAEGGFFTDSARAEFITVSPRPPEHQPDSHYPLILNTGRLRDQWHTMTRTALASKLNQHRPEPFVEIHPQDAGLYRLVVNGLAKLETQWGTMLARVLITNTQKPGNVFVPMHWTEQYSSQGRMGALVNPAIDPYSKQPESKHTPVRISPFPARWYGFMLSRREININHCDYWVKIRGDGFYRYELAANTSIENWQDFMANSFAIIIEKQNWQHYQDAVKGLYRSAELINNQLQTVIFIAATPHMPDIGWLSSLFAKNELEKQERLALLTGNPPIGVEDSGACVCACFNVGEKTILTAIRDKQLKNHQDVGRCLKAGTNCGSCIPEIKALLLAVKT